MESYDTGARRHRVKNRENKTCSAKNSVPLGHMVLCLRPDLDFRFQMDLIFLKYFFTDNLDHVHHVIGLAAGVGDDEVGVLCAHFRPADLKTFQTGLVDEGPSTQPSRIFEH